MSASITELIDCIRVCDAAIMRAELHVAVTDRYREALDAIIDQRGSSGGWPPVDVNRVVGWAVVRVVARAFHKQPLEVARDLIRRWEQVR